ncbi:ABC transporter ATP-binding protein [Patescibacteria group bacterium]|nr:ABC transporter ATP-binding protein [Patescibacteria group bacterium]MBU2264568.1 ABC transporter ATP-binding protein [Patescibacteria group bacterium]
MLIKLANITKDYVDEGVPTTALRGVTLAVSAGEFVAIMGASGSGKSTLMHVIGFLDKKTTGQYFFDNENANEFDDANLAQIRNQKIGFVFQAYNLLARTSVLDNVLLPTIYTPHLDVKATAKKAREILAKLNLSHRVDYQPNQLSGGEQQRAAIARALINEPRLILADEPTGNLDSHSGQEVMEVLQDLNEEGHTIVMVTHEKYVAECARRIITLKDGQIISDQKVAERHLAKDGLIK